MTSLRRALWGALPVLGLAALAGVALIMPGRQSPEPDALIPVPVATTPETRIHYPANGLPVLQLPDGSQRRIHSLIDVRRTMRFGDFIWDEAGIAPGPIWVRIDLGRQTLSVFRNGHEIGTAVILYGTGGHPTPLGAFNISQKARSYWSRSYDAPMPYMLRLTDDGVAIHASDVREGRATHGCIGVPEGFARHLFEAAQRGDLVVIEGADAKATA